MLAALAVAALWSLATASRPVLAETCVTVGPLSVQGQQVVPVQTECSPVP